MKKTAYYFLSLIFAGFVLFFASCTETLDNYELVDESNNRLVVDGHITTDTGAHWVKLKRSVPYFYNQPSPPVSGAFVTITDGDNVFPLVEDGNTGIYYTSPDVAAEKGKTYTLNIQLESGETYTASSYVTPLNEIDSISYYYTDQENPFDNDFYYYIYFYGQEQGDTENYYLWNLYVDNELESDTLSEVVFQSDDFVNGNYIHDVAFFAIEDYKIQDNGPTPVKLEMLSIPKEYFNFLISFMVETDWRGGLFDGPPANIPGNISGDALGFFYAADVAADSTLIHYRQNVVEPPF